MTILLVLENGFFVKGHIEILLLGFKGIFENLEEIIPI